MKKKIVNNTSSDESDVPKKKKSTKKISTSSDESDVPKKKKSTKKISTSSDESDVPKKKKPAKKISTSSDESDVPKKKKSTKKISTSSDEDNSKESNSSSSSSEVFVPQKKTKPKPKSKSKTSSSPKTSSENTTAPYELKGYDLLHNNQKQVIEEACELLKTKRAVCLSLPMGYGKTLISLMMAITKYKLVLVVCSKTLISNWVLEIKKFFGNNIKYEVVHSEFMKTGIKTWQPQKDTRIVLTTSQVLAQSYTKDIADKFVFLPPIRRFGQNEHIYLSFDEPLTTNKVGPGYLHSHKWDAIFIDECHNYTMVTSKACRAIASLAAKHKILLSGTVFQEPKFDRIFGFIILLDIPGVRDVLSCRNLIYDSKFAGILQFCIHREKNDDFNDVELVKKVIFHNLSEDEAKCYGVIRNMIIDIHKEYTKQMALLHHERNYQHIRHLSGSLLATVSWLRQAVVMPSIPLSKMLMTMIDEDDDDSDVDAEKPDANIITEILEKVINKYNLDKWFKSTKLESSTRIAKCLEIINQHKNEKKIIFCSFILCMNFVYKLCESMGMDELYMITGQMSLPVRTKILADFENSKGGILFASYNIGSEGLNLQHANVVIMLDLYWNRGKQDQGLARVFRYGQKNKQVYQYLLISNTGLEKKMLEKQNDKLKILNELNTGAVKTKKIAAIKIEEIVQIINEDTNFDLANVVTNFDLMKNNNTVETNSPSSSKSNVDIYKIYDIKRNISIDELRNVYYALVRKHINSNDNVKKNILTIWDILSNDTKKRQYDNGKINVDLLPMKNKVL